MRKLASVVILLVVAGLSRAEDMSASDQLSILYSPRFSFDRDGVPLVTVEIMGGQDEIRLSARGGVDVLPGGEGGAEVRGGDRWTIRAERARPGVVHDWTIVAQLDADDERGAERAIATWKARGLEARAFETGTVFGVDGRVVDSRQLLVGVAPVPRGEGHARAAELAARYGVETSVHEDLSERPTGTLVATSADGATTVRNPSVLWFAPRDRAATLEIADVVFGHGGSQLRAEQREDRRYYGMVYVTLGTDGKLVVVNAVDAETLLEGLVPAEIFPDAPHEALKAQAVAARTELLERIGTRHHADPFLLCSTQQCQVYGGAGKEHPRTTRAVRATRGQLMVRDGGGLVDARYHAACGGHTEHKENIWGGDPDPSLRGSVDAVAPKAAARFASITERELPAFLAVPAEDSFCGATRYGKGRYRWTTTIDASTMNERVAAHYPNVGAVTALRPLERGVSGRIRRIEITGTKGKAVAIGDLHIRRLLGGLKSSLFEVKARGRADRPDAFIFRGAGFGHGVGMCQTGAIGRAEAGHTYRKILDHYYPGSRVETLY